MSGRTILQSGSSCSDLFVYVHIEGSYIAPRVKQVTTDAFVTELRGAGTSAYKGIIAGHGGWAGYVHEIASTIGHPFKRTCLITWSAGSQCALEAAASAETPDAIVMMDGLYGGKPAGSKMGDGKVNWTPALEALGNYAVQAARGEKILVMFHSNIPTPYASSKECVNAVRAYVESKIGTAMDPIGLAATDTDGHACKAAWELGNLRIVEFAGQDAKEHITIAHLYDEACALWVPWLNDATTCDTSAPTIPAPALTYPSAPPTRDLRNVRPMLQGEDVRSWQSYLVSQGVNVDVDGVFGPKSEAATRTWQIAYGLPQTGVVTDKEREVAGLAKAAPTGNSAPAIDAPKAIDPAKPSTLSEATLQMAQKDLDAGVWEDLGHNDGKRLRDYFAAVGLKGGTWEWCGAASSYWILEAAKWIGQKAPVVGSAGARALMCQFQTAKRFYSASALRKDPSLLKPGMVVFFDRSTPTAKWLGHVEICEVHEGSSLDYKSIGGNTGPKGDRVWRNSRKITDDKFLGAGWLD